MIVKSTNRGQMPSTVAARSELRPAARDFDIVLCVPLNQSFNMPKNNRSQGRNVRVCIEHEGKLKSLLFISFLPGGDVSVGFVDKAFRVREFVDPSVVGGLRAEPINLSAMHGEDALINPHFTLHGGAYFHLRSNNQPELLSGLVWTKPSPGEDHSPWLRFTSRPVSELPSYKDLASGNTAEIAVLSATNEDCSVAVHVDFVAESSINKYGTGAKVYAWGDYHLRIIAFIIPPQQATIGYEIMG